MTLSVKSLRRMILFLLYINSLSSADSGGYLFYGSNYTAYLVDMNGTTMHTWKASGKIQCVAYLLEDGSVLFPSDNRCGVQINGTHAHGRIQKIAWDGTITWDYKFCPSGWGPGYDIEPMPNGNVLVPADNTSKAGIIYEIKPSGSSDGEIVWQCQLPDSLNASSGGTSGGPGGPGGGGGMSGTYINSVSYNPDLDYILVDLQESVRKLVVIDHSVSGGKIVYTYAAATSGRLHGAIWSSKYYMGTKTTIAGADTTAMRVGNLLVVNNSGSGVVEVNMKTNTKVKTISYTFANNEGSVQRLPNGNTLVQKGMDQTAIAILNDNGTTVSSYTAKGVCNRAYWYGTDYPGVSKLGTSSNLMAASVKKEYTFPIRYDASLNICHLSANNGNTSFSYRVFSLDGKILLSSMSSGPEASFSTDHFQSGIYFVEIRNALGTQKAQFYKLH
ncbi:MAG TPA: T9SS type A sorting domain-containing protein [Chitinispirillaceae bacterium]|nr:T9SS type A sorting domain-containing protein [Chitinispirillaceae bacterium]